MMAEHFVPSSANETAVALPIPLLAPMTSATPPFSPNSMETSSMCRTQHRATNLFMGDFAVRALELPINAAMRQNIGA